MGLVLLEIRGLCDSEFHEMGYRNPNIAFGDLVSRELRETVSQQDAHERMQVAKYYAEDKKAQELIPWSGLCELAAPPLQTKW